jgi:hypothetical protein
LRAEEIVAPVGVAVKGGTGLDQLDGFSENVGLTGFAELEGPHPQWNMPVVRWGLSPKSLLRVGRHRGPFLLILKGLTYHPQQTVQVFLSGKLIHKHTFSKPGVFETLNIPLRGDGSDMTVELVYKHSEKPTLTDSRPRAVLFRCIQLAQDRR